ncbi:MAG TPA: hypothetical protein VK400_01355, partial [Pyrinomonadaceae bacterium]|nr:hypothetical protein [Pyrinomonadaceae bacterium]
MSAIFAIALAICFLLPTMAFSQTTLEWMVLSRGRSAANVTGEDSRDADAKYSREDVERIKQNSLEHLKNRASRRGLISAPDDFAIQKIEVDELEMIHVRARQTLDGIPVWGGEAIVHLNADESLFAVTDEMKNIARIGTNPNFAAADAVELAKRFYQGSKFLTEEPEVDL